MTEQAGARYAWYGRVSTEDEQDPTVSFPRQFDNAKRRVADAGGGIRTKPTQAVVGAS